MNNYLILDLETTSYGSYLRDLNPWDDRNKVVAIIKKQAGTPTRVAYNEEGFSRAMNLELEGVDVIVGHNIRYDLAYFWRNPSLLAFLRRGGKIWDTWIAEYFLDGQRAIKRPFGNVQIPRNLGVVAQKYGGTAKLDESKAYFSDSNGLGFLNLPKELWDAYTIADGDNTEKVYLGQLRRAEKYKMLPLLQEHMEYALATLEAEYNGMRLDIAAAKEVLIESELELDATMTKLSGFLAGAWADSPVEFSPTSQEHISIAIYGGAVKYREKRPVYDSDGQQVFIKKTGLPKLVFKELTHNIVGLDPYLPQFGGAKNGIFSVSETVLALIPHTSPAKEFANAVLQYRQVYKTLHTYCEPFLKVGVYPDQTIKGGYKHATTVTGRVSSTEPNMQNLSSSLHRLFIPSFDNGVLVEIDLRTIEVVLGAIWSKDPVLLDELRRGLDMHTRNAALMNGIPEAEVTPEQRQKAKAATFAKWYWAGSQKIAALTGMSEYEANTFITTFNKKYKRFVKWGKDLIDAVGTNEWYDPQLNKVFGNNITPYGKYYVSEKILSNGTLRYNVNQIVNVQIQGLCADILAYIAGHIYRLGLEEHFKFKLTGFIHDSVLLNFRNKEDMCLILPKIQAILDNINKHFKDVYELDFILPINYDMKATTTNWGEMSKLTMNEQEGITYEH